jgi:hypothetical protein
MHGSINIKNGAECFDPGGQTQAIYLLPKCTIVAVILAGVIWLRSQVTCVKLVDIKIK